jgi:hypothetical protein
MGIISHFVADGAQPLHTTEHYNGWVGPNPKGYTVDRSFHRFIDGGAIDLFAIKPESLLGRARARKTVTKTKYWPQICEYLYESHELVEPLYALEKSGDLYKRPGKRFIEDRLLEAGAMLAGIWVAAYEGAVIDDFRVRRLTAGKESPSTQPAEPALPVLLQGLRRSSGQGMPNQ